MTAGQLMVDANLPALSLAIVERGRVVRTFAAGAGVTEATRFQVCCLGKPVTAAAIGMLVAEGRLDLDDPAARYLPESHLPRPLEAARTITIRQLLSHRAGVIRGSFRPYVRSAEEYAAEAHSSELSFTPGVEYKFSNLGYFLAGAVLERVSGRSVPEFLAERIFRPLGMTRTTFDRPADIPEGHSRGEYYALVHADDVLQPAPCFPLPAASGGFYCTATDYARFLAAATTSLRQTGSNSGYSGVALRDADRGFAAVALCNRANASHELARALDAGDAATSDAFAGDFAGASDLLRLRPNGRGLLAELGPARFALRRRGARSFLCEGGPLREYLLRFSVREGRARACSAGPHYFAHDGAAPGAAIAPDIAGRYVYAPYATAEVFARHGALFCQCGPLHESRLVPAGHDCYRECGGLFDGEMLRVRRAAAERLLGIEIGGMTFARVEGD